MPFLCLTILNVVPYVILCLYFSCIEMKNVLAVLYVFVYVVRHLQVSFRPSSFISLCTRISVAVLSVSIKGLPAMSGVLT